MLEEDDLLKLNAFLAKEPIPEGLSAHRVVILSTSRGDLFRIANLAARKLKREYGGYCATTQEKGFHVIYLTSSNAPNVDHVELTSEGGKMIVKVKYGGKVDVGRNIIKKLVEDALRSRLNELGYRRGTGRKYYQPKTRKLMWNRLQLNMEEPYYLYDGFRIAVRTFGDNLLVFLDPRVVLQISLLEYVRNLEEKGYAKDMARRLLLDEDYRIRRRVTVYPSHTEGRIKEIHFDEGIDSMLEGVGITVGEYWREVYHVELPNDDFLVEVRLISGKIDLIYPASKVYPTTKEVKIGARERRLYSPKDRYERTIRLAREILSDPLILGDYKISFDVNELLPLSLAKERGIVSGWGNHNPPSLVFRNEKVGKKPTDLRRYGPFSGPIDLSVFYVVPESLADKADFIHNVLSNIYKEYQLGSLRKDQVIPYKETEEDMRELGELIATKMNVNEPKIGVVTVSNLEDKWEILKGGAREKYLQFMTLRTFNSLLRGEERERRGKAANLVIQMYFKACPQEDRVPWALLEPAGADPSTIYIGFDVSRRMRYEGDLDSLIERTEVAVRAAICDPRGTVVRMKTLPPAKGETLGSKLIEDLLESTVAEASRIMRKSPRRIVLMKDGSVRGEERELVKLGVERYASRKGLKVELYSVEKRIVERLYSGEDNSPKAGTYVVIDDRTVLLNSSAPRGMLAAPLRITRVLDFPEGSAPNIEEFAREFYNLSHLHWHSLFTKIKTALPLKIVQEIGEYATRGVNIPENVPYLPL